MMPPELMLVSWLCIMYELAEADAWGYLPWSEPLWRPR
jgi:hypothetical protein